MSSGGQPAGSADTALLFLVLIVLLMMRRVYRSYRGVRFNASRTIGVLVFYVAFGSFFAITSFFEGVPLVFAVPDIAVLVAASIWSYRYSDRRISFWKGGDGSVYFKGGVVLYLVYLVGLIARLSIAFIFLGPNFLSFTPGETLSANALDATVATDLLLMLGLGLLIGRNWRVLKRYRGIEKGLEPLPDTAPPLGPIFGSKKVETSTQQ